MITLKELKNYRVGILIGVIILVILIGIIVYADNNSHHSSNLQDVTVQDINNSSYKVWGETVQFSNGKYQSTDTHDLLSSTIDFSAIGDVNGDGKRDALVVTTTARGDSIDELHLVIKFSNIVATTPLNIPLPKGETVRNIRALSIDPSGTINLTLDILGPNDPHCCASIHATHQYKLENSKLALIK